MIRRRSRPSHRWLPLLLPVAMAQMLGASAANRVQVTRQVAIELAVAPINAAPAAGTEAGALSLVARPRDPGQTEFALHWPDPAATSRLKLRAAQRAPSAGQTHAVEIEAELTLPDGSRVRATRELEFDERATSLFEVYRIGDRTLTLVVEASAEEETVVSKHDTVGVPVRFLVEIQRVAAGRAVTLETDYLQTFVGEPVAYSFSLGAAEDADSVHFSLKPLRISGNLLEVEVDASGTMPGEDGPLLLGRREKLIASQGAVSTLSFESGEPPTGYRFLVTANF